MWKSILVIACLVSQISWNVVAAAGLDYSKADNWATLENKEPKIIDCFYIAPTIDIRKAPMNVNINDPKIRGNILGATNMTNGIYNQSCRMFVPYYTQMTMGPYYLARDKGAATITSYENMAYEDVKAAFNYYLDNYNKAKYGRRGIVVAGFSQGAELGTRLLADFATDKRFKNNFVAAYLIGWPVTECYYKQNPKVKPAQGEKDLGVVISFETEAPNVTDNPLTKGVELSAGPDKCHIVAINPLNWRTDNKYASPSYNKGACFTDYSGNIIKEIPHLTGAYLDKDRHTLKVTGINPVEYPSHLEIFPEGIYHTYDNAFFYRNLQDNVNTRVQEYNDKHDDPTTIPWDWHIPHTTGFPW